MTTFSYSYKDLPLGSNEIRILEVQPSAYSDELVQASLFKAHLDHLPSYTALSYTWGDEAKRENILLGGRVLSITKSLELALRALRASDGAVLLWIDQICINQKDNEEKSRQIPLMRNIYTRSTQTVGWLGDATANSDAAMQYMIRIGTQTSRMGLATLDEERLQLLLANEADIQSGMVAINAEKRRWRDAVYQMINAEGNLFNHPAIEGIIDLCDRTYFKRGWIQQEIAIPPRMLFKWGRLNIDATTFAAATNFHLVFVQARIQTLVTPQMMQDTHARSFLSRLQDAQIWSHIQPSMILRQHYHDPAYASRLSFARVIERIRRIDFRQAPDRIYGILGVVNDGQMIVPDVDVKRSFQDVFTKATKRIIDKPVTETNSVEGVNFLCLNNKSMQSSQNLPSWVPDLTQIGRISTLLNETTTLAVPYHASRGITHAPGSSDLPDKQIRVRGVVVDSIMEVGPAWMTDASGQKEHHGGLEALLCFDNFANMSVALVTSNSSSQHPFRSDPQRLAEAKWRVPVLNLESISSTGTSREATAWSQRGHEAVEFTMAFQRHQPDIERILTKLPLTADEETQLKHLSGYDRTVAEVQLKMKKAEEAHNTPEHTAYHTLLHPLKDRRPFIGDNGFVGMGPQAMQAGDLVCVLFGGSFPFILRQSVGEGGLHKLVGECFCDGVINGEALRIGLSARDFVLG